MTDRTAETSNKQAQGYGDLVILVLISAVLLSLGAGIIWGVGGTLFAAGLSLLAVAVGASIERTIKETR